MVFGTSPLAEARGLFQFKVPVRTFPLAVIALSVLALVMTGIYWPGLHGGFFFDDQPNILANESLQLETLSLDSLRAVVIGGGAGPFGRPIAQLSFAVNYYLGGFYPLAFKLTNLAIHAVNGVLVFFLAMRLFAYLKPSNRQVASGLLAAVWLLHPIQMLAVLHVVQRMSLLSALFVLAALLCHIRARQTAYMSAKAWTTLVLGWLLFWPLSFLSKETGLLFPLFALAWELIMRRTANGHLDRFARVFAWLVGVASLLCAAYLLSPQGNWLWIGYSFRSFSVGERLLTEGRVLWFYLGLILFPRLEAFGLFHDDMVLSTGMLAPWSTLPALIGVCALGWLVWVMRLRLPLVSFGIAWFLIGHALESTFLPLEIAHEHRNYLPLFGTLLALVSLLMRLVGAGGSRKVAGVALLGAMLAYSSFITAMRAHQFGDDVRRSQIEAQHHRGSAQAQHEAGRVLAALAGSDSFDSPLRSLAQAHYELAGQLDPNAKMSWLGLIHLDCLTGSPVNRHWVDELRRRLRDTPFSPGDRGVLYSLKEMSVAGSLCLERTDVDALFSAAIANPKNLPGVRAVLLSWHADYLWLREKDLAAAQTALADSLSLVPKNPSNRLKWAQLRFIGGERDQVREILLELRGERLSSEEQKTLNELLANI